MLKIANESKAQVWIRRGATWFGCGLATKAPGTVGTVAAIPLVWLISLCQPLWVQGLLIIAFCLVAIWIAHMDSLWSGQGDDPQIVIDEVAGFLVSMAFLPFAWHWLLFGFTLFRVLDIVKPPPISWLDRKGRGGIGIVGDDLLAGLIVNAILQFALVWHSQ